MTLKGEPGDTGFLEPVQKWRPDFRFTERATVTYNGGTWQALRDTNSEPENDNESDWVCLAVGLRSIAFSNFSADKLKVVIEDTRGESHVSNVDLPLPKFFRNWEKDKTYEVMDSVIDDGNRWIAKCDRPMGAPRKSTDWALFGMRGPRGTIGRTGPSGEPCQDSREAGAD
jgi:hypothetical protein